MSTIRLIKNSKTGLYFDGVTFNADILNAKDIGSASIEDMRLFWAGSDLEIVEVKLETSDPYEEARKFVIRSGRDTHFALVDGKEIARRVHVPARSGSPVWLKYKGNEIALVLKNGRLQSDWG